MTKLLKKLLFWLFITFLVIVMGYLGVKTYVDANCTRGVNYLTDKYEIKAKEIKCNKYQEYVYEDIANCDSLWLKKCTNDENLIYEYNAVWTDKARGYGCIYECNNSVKNVVFRNNSIGFALATWADFLGCCVITMGNRRTTTWQDVHFENIEVYISYHAIINITLEDSLSNGIDGGKARDIYFENITAYRAYGLALRIYVQSGSSLGKVYLDNIKYNEHKLEESDLTSESVSILHYNPSWSITSNVKVNSLTE